MNPFPYIRIRKVATAEKPPKGFVDLRYDTDQASLVAIDDAGAEVPVAGSLPTDANGNLEVQAIVFADTGEASLDEGALGLNGNGELVLHDGLDTGDELPTSLFNHRISGFQAISGAQNIAGINQLLGSFVLPASKAIVGTTYRIRGSWTIVYAAGTNTPEFTLGFCPVGSAAAGNGVGFRNTVDSAFLQMAHAVIEFEITDAGGGSFLAVGTNTSMGVVIYDVSGNLTGAANTPPTNPFEAEIGTLGVTQNVGLYYGTAATPSAPACEIQYDFTIEQTA